MDNGASSYRRFLEGDKNALIDIIEDYREGLVLFLNSIMGDFCLAEEIAEETFLKLYVDKPKFAEKCSFKTWIYTIGKNAAIDHIRKMSKYGEMTADNFYDIADRQNIEQNYIRDEDKKQLLRALEKLNDDYRQVLYLIYFENFSNTETAKIMGKSEKQIRNLLYRSKESLRNILEKEGFRYEGI
ncbi:MULTISPECIES: RNA polymerase sigma factor [Ruminococcus]|uniref:RNA polymerase, sigma-24 subunit, RpoE n=1 Tax=Ruminococcus flavefaciens TaxID=1265 RepID=A0A1M7K664_RUMFL|nr:MULTISPECIES: RNA polymerase sigma factor [Ruminococcus]MCR4793765.1 RNA polymerase sigma factor [Ruminococcus sp.]SHM60780.1 RNA polymerase, sigma-24 subunit, RpoE [Ruminococcus flavefaciens]